MICHLSLGSNLHDRLSNLRCALNEVARQVGPIRTSSSVYATQPTEFTDQPEFLNLTAEVETHHPPMQLLRLCLAIEEGMGRVRTIRFGPRNIDIDILLMGTIEHHSSDLIIPHPRMHLRRFVLIPLCEIAHEAVHPGLDCTAKELLASSRDFSRVERYCEPLI